MQKLHTWIILCLLLTTACAPAEKPIPAQRISPTQAPSFTEEADLSTQRVPPNTTKKGDFKRTSPAVPGTKTPAETPQPARQPPDRSAYRPLASNPIPPACQIDPYSAPESEINHLTVIQLGMCWAGVLNPEGAASHLSQALFFAGENVTIVMTLDSVPDDSIRAKELRVDLAYQAGRWAVIWSGGRWICQAGRGQQDWGADLCL